MPEAQNVRDVTVEDFDLGVLEESYQRPVVVDFWAPWCGPCRALSPILERLAAEFQGAFLLAKVNTEENPELAEHFQIRSIPNVKVFREGAVVDEVVGALPESEMRRFLRAHCPSAADLRFADATAAIAGGDVQRARTVLHELLRADPAHAGALLELGKLEAGAGDFEAAAALWSRIPETSPLADHAQTLRRSLDFQKLCHDGGGLQTARSRAAADPSDLDARYRLGCCYAAGGNYREALEEFLYVVSRNKNYQEQAARKAMLTVFELIGARSELSEEYRKKLAMALF